VKWAPKQAHHKRAGLLQQDNHPEQVPPPAELLLYQVYKYSMILNELYDRSPEAYQDLSQDNSQPKLGDLRKTRLTLRQLSKLRQMNDVRNYEYKEKLKNIRKQYAPPPAAPAM
jgi:hypothetical protein